MESSGIVFTEPGRTGRYAAMADPKLQRERARRGARERESTCFEARGERESLAYVWERERRRSVQGD